MVMSLTAQWPPRQGNYHGEVSSYVDYNSINGVEHVTKEA